MSVRPGSRMVVRPDGSLQVVTSAPDADTDQTDAEELGNRFDQLMQEDDQRETAEERAMASSRQAAQQPQRPLPGMPTPARMLEQERAKKSATTPDADDQPSNDPSIQASVKEQAQASKRKGDSKGGEDSGGSEDGSGAVMAQQVDVASPQSDQPTPAATPAPPPAAAQVISEISGEVASRISTARGKGESRVQIDLREELLPQTSITIEDKEAMVVVTLSTTSNSSSDVLASHARSLGQAISRRTGRATRVDFAGNSWSTDGGEEPPEDADSTNEPRNPA